MPHPWFRPERQEKKTWNGTKFWFESDNFSIEFDTSTYSSISSLDTNLYLFKVAFTVLVENYGFLSKAAKNCASFKLHINKINGRNDAMMWNFSNAYIECHRVHLWMKNCRIETVKQILLIEMYEIKLLNSGEGI